MAIVNPSEKAFEDYLDNHGLTYERDFEVSETGKDIDFFVHASEQDVYCEVKEVRESSTLKPPRIYANRNIQNHMLKLRKKFRKRRPDHPLLLVSMNYSNQFFTGYTVAVAMLGQVGFTIDVNSDRVIEPAHITGANAATTQEHNRSISGVFVYSKSQSIQNIYANPYAVHPISETTFPNTQIIKIHAGLSPQELMSLGDWRHWPETNCDT